jgi:hypothetical protein
MSVAPTCAPHAVGGGNRKYTLRRPGATCRGAAGQHAVCLEPLLGTSAASEFYRSLSLPFNVIVQNGAEAPPGGPLR